MNPTHPLIIGIGNDGRQDDGLGWAFVDALERGGYPAERLVRRFQLQIEDAEMICHEEHVIFVDAYRRPLADGFAWRTCVAAIGLDYTSHSLAPQTVLGLCERLYPNTPQAELLLIEGSVWELAIGLSSIASDHLQRALQAFSDRIPTLLVDPGKPEADERGQKL